MAVIEKSITLAGSKGEKEVMAIFDSGATYSCIRPEIADELEVSTKLPSQMIFLTAEEGRKVTATECVRLDIHIDGYRLSDEFMIVDGLSEPVIIGAATLQKWRIKLDFELDKVIIDPKVTKFRLLKL